MHQVVCKAGRYLNRAVLRDGKFAYEVDASTGEKISAKYNIVRHAGAAMSLVEVCGLTDSARRALGYLSQKIQRTELGGLAVFKNGVSALGATALAACAFARASSVSREYLPVVIGLATQIKNQMRADGTFEHHYPSGTDKSDCDYYPGEAALAFCVTARVARDNGWYKLSLKALEAISAGPAPKNFSAHWFCHAAEDIDDAGAVSQEVVAHALRLAGDEASRILGAGDVMGYCAHKTCRAAVRLEAIGAALQIAKRRGGDARDLYAACAKLVAAIQRSCVTTGPCSGAFIDEIGGRVVRIDTVQHVIEGLMRIES